MKGTAKISLCMIVRNEETHLRRCLESLAGAVDEIIVVDTGSTDGTVELAEELGAQVFHYTWQDDFSAARNASLEHARHPWILYLDADEFLEGGGAEKIRQAASQEDAGGIEFVIGGIRQVRMFRRAPSIRFRNIIHEQIVPALLEYCEARGLRILARDISLGHSGYAADGSLSPEKLKRNERLFRKQLELAPEDPYTWYKYADLLRRQDPARSSQAIARSHELLEQLPAPEARQQIYAAEVCAFRAFDLLHENRGREALELLDRAADRYERTPNFCYTRGCVELQAGDPGKALGHFRRLTEDRDKVFQVPLQEGITEHVAQFGIGECLIRLGRGEEARAAYRKALEYHPGYQQALSALVQLLRASGKQAEALEAIENHLRVEPGNGHAWWDGGSLLLENRDFPQASEWLGKVAGMEEAPASLKHEYALARLGCGEKDEAEKVWRSLPGGPEREAGLWILEFLESGKEPGKVENETAEVLTRSLALFR